jgi:hypothetical protein
MNNITKATLELEAIQSVKRELHEALITKDLPARDSAAVRLVALYATLDVNNLLNIINEINSLKEVA